MRIANFHMDDEGPRFFDPTDSTPTSNFSACIVV
jgi:hypothetical protein